MTIRRRRLHYSAALSRRWLWLGLAMILFPAVLWQQARLVSAEDPPPYFNVCGPYSSEDCDDLEIDCKFCITTAECPDGSMGLPFLFYCAECCYGWKTRCANGTLDYDCETETWSGTPACPEQPFVPCELEPIWP